jgi:hypothetical protein
MVFLEKPFFNALFDNRYVLEYIAVSMSKEAQKNLFWAQATAFGALWGALEITLGAFLHSLRIPLNGAILASLSAALLVAERQMIPKRGISLATAVVAAMCKSISPGGVILGPMVAIVVEGLLVEASLLLSPRALPSAVLAGSVCALWTIGQRLLTQVVYFGSSIIDLYLSLISQVGDWFAVSSRSGWWILGLLGLLVVLMGAVGGVLGWNLGRDAARNLASSSCQGWDP